MSGVLVEGYKNTRDTFNKQECFPLKDILTRESAYVKLVCPVGMNYFYGTCEVPAGNYSEKLREIDLGSTISVIKSNAFDGLNGITSLKLPDSLLEIEPNAFAGCPNLSFDVLDVGSITLGANAFSGMKINKIIAESMLIAGDSVTSATTGPFWHANVDQIEIGDYVNYIPPYYFSGVFFNSAEHIYLNEITEIAKCGFAESYDLNIWLNKEVWVMDDTAFNNCIRLHAHLQFGSVPHRVFESNNMEFETFY